MNGDAALLAKAISVALFLILPAAFALIAARQMRKRSGSRRSAARLCLLACIIWLAIMPIFMFFHKHLPFWAGSGLAAAAMIALPGLAAISLIYSFGQDRS